MSRPEVVLCQKRWMFPAVLFPSAVDRTHTRTWTGRAVLANTKSALSAATILLTSEELLVKGRILRTCHVRIRLADIVSVAPLGDKRGAILIEFTAWDRSKVARLAMSGQPGAAPDRLILNVDEPKAWLHELGRRIPGDAPDQS